VKFLFSLSVGNSIIKLNPSIEALRSKSVSITNMVQKIISIHTPKAGGTSMLDIWKQAFGESQVLMDYDDPPVNPAADFIIDPVSWADS
jgi:hypothetical protein